MDRGQISTMNKTVKTQEVTRDGTLFTQKETTLLGNIDTTGMSKLQKKKLKKKLKKQLDGGVREEKDEPEEKKPVEKQ